MTRPTHGTLHHVEIWVPDLSRALASLGWLLATLGYTVSQSWASGRSWLLGPTYLVLEQSPSLTADRHDRRRPGLNHLAFHVEDAAAVEKLTVEAAQHGWRLMFPELHPHAGGSQHYAAYMENVDGFEVELVVISPPPDEPVPNRVATAR
ncbi:VOC family protein [Streptomyces sp. OM5714]|uniref:VOC family protein n=1 Tax=Streptomyces TaxID=1883 RepID=UPI0013DB4038|nr:VOC family protein [Streptomyces sp. OM5714]KAF2779745.1 Glyoxalase/bleomycin resistance protein/dioxygenase [Streptomyces sp. OM5714]